MVRPLVLVLSFLLGSGVLGAQDLGRTERLWREYLSETVRRGLPLLNFDPGTVPFWPVLNRYRHEAQSLEPGDDVTLLGVWIDRAEGSGASLNSVLKASWPRPALVRFPVKLWAEALFSLWDPSSEPREWTEAWLGWADKAYSPQVLLLGLTAFEKIDPSAVLPLLKQSLGLYPEDRRFLALVARHPESVVQAEGLLARDRERSGGWSVSALKSLLTRNSGAKALLLEAGYPEPVLEAALDRDYGSWLATASETPAPGSWTWDADQDGRDESRLVFQADAPESWSRTTSEGLWTLSWEKGRPDTLRETRSGASWTLRWESYPWASSLEYRWGNRTLVYRFPPLSQAVPLWPEERLKVSPGRLPAALAVLWLPLDPRALASTASTVETWAGFRKVSTVFLFQGEVWMETADTNQDGREDVWTYYRSGRVASVYQDLEGRGQASLREMYSRGELSQVQVRAAEAPRTEFVLFPREGVQLWDPHGDRRPLERLFVWTGTGSLDALVFTKAEMPWETMPAWEPRP